MADQVAPVHNDLMSDRPSLFQIVVQARPKPDGGYTYIIARKDDPQWSEGSDETFATPQEALAAGQAALQRRYPQA